MSAPLARTLFRPAAAAAATPAARPSRAVCPAARFFPLASSSSSTASSRTHAPASSTRSTRLVNAVAHLSVGAAVLASASFIQPAKLQVLVVPVHPIRRDVFERHVQLVRQHATVPLAEVPPDKRGDRAIFSASPASSGSLLFDFVTPATYASRRPFSFLADLQTHRRVQGIIGILDASEYALGSLDDALASFQASLSDLPKTFATRIYGFAASEKQVEAARMLKESDGLVMVPEEGDVGFYLKTFLADFASGILWEFSNMAAQLESRTSIATPQESMQNALDRAPSRASVDSVRSHAFSDRSGTPIQPNGTPLLSVTAPVPSHPHVAPKGISASPKRDSLPFASSPHLPQSVKPVLPRTSSASGVATTAQLVDVRARKRVAGREKKLMGDMWLLSGRPQEAITAFNEAILLTKAWADQVWQASAYEGFAVALILQAMQPRGSQAAHPPTFGPSRSDSPGPATIFSNPDMSTFLSAIPERLTLAATLYEKMLTPLRSLRNPTAPLDPDRAHPILYVEACLRNANFLLAVNEAKGSMPKALQALLSPPADQGEVDGVDQARRARVNSLAPSNTVPRSSIAIWLNSAYSAHLAALAPSVRILVLTEVARLYGRIGYRRKEAFVLREVVALRADALALERAEEDGWLSPGSPASPTSARAGLPLGMPVARPSNPRGGGDDSITRAVERVCGVFGLGSASAPLANLDALGAPEVTLQRRFGWPAIQLGVLKDAILISRNLQDYQTAVRLAMLALRALAALVSPDEQFDLSQSIPQITTAAAHLGAGFELDYWGPAQLVQGIEVGSLSPSRRPYEGRSPAPTDPAIAAGPAPPPQNPFLYDPRARASGALPAQTILVQDEIAEFYVTLRNPFLCPLDIKGISLSTDGLDFASDVVSISLPPAASETVRLSGTPRGSGTLQVRGCWVQLAGCRVCEIVPAPIRSDREDAAARKAGVMAAQRERIKASGLDAILAPSPRQSGTASSIRSVTAASQPTTSSPPSYPVIPPQPLLWLKSDSLTSGAMSIFDGETRPISITVENTSATPVDFVQLTFSDSLTTSAQAYLAESGLDAAEVYMLESDAAERPVFRWHGDLETSIPPGASHTLEVACRGKLGCMSGSIQIDYGFRGNEGGHAKFWTRRVKCDVLLTVHQTLVAHSLDISHVESVPGPERRHLRSASVISLGSRQADGPSAEASAGTYGDECLITIDVTNVGDKAFEIKLEQAEGGDGKYLECQRAEPGATQKLRLRMDRLRLASELLARPIPSFSERQFIVDQVPRSKDDEQLRRELFWYRQELIGSSRSGDIGLRALQLEPSMLDELRRDDIQVRLSLAGDSVVRAKAGDESQGPTYTASADDFLQIEAHVASAAAHPLSLRLRLQLVPPDPDAPSSSLSHLARYVVIEGVSPLDLGRLEPGRQTKAGVPVCLLAQGRYEFACTVEESGNEGVVAAGRRPRTWRSRRALVVSVEA
ncbi:hypothetical protein JCM8202v2_003536 [Rhodotorula sphaerocarpa]